MIDNNFLKVLVDPESGSSLTWSDGDVLRVGGVQYSVIEGVPRIVAGKVNVESSKLHTDMNSHFDYREHYVKDAEVFDYFHELDSPATKAEAHRLHQTISRAVPKQSQLMLDAGCGNGWLAKRFVPKGKFVISMDISPINPTRIHKEVAASNHLGLVADVFHLPLKPNSFDTVVASEIMEHVPDPKRFVQSLYAVVKPGGRLIITTPYNEKIIYHLCVHCNRPTPALAHIHSFNENNIGALIPQGATWHWSAFSNKYLSRLRSHIILNFLGYGVWRFVDKIFNFLFGQPQRLMIIIEKPAL